MTTLGTVAIIPARGGSKRIERKNIKDFAGKPVMAYSIEAALASGCFDRVMVSTDDAEIADVARRYGAEVPFMRSPANSDDHATTADVIREVLDRYREDGIEFRTLCCIYATAPFVTASRLRAGAELLVGGNAEAAFTCVAYSYPTQRCLVKNAEGRIHLKFPEYATARSQDLEPTYHDAGQFYFSTVEAFERNGSLWGPDTVPIILSELEVQDLDTPTDWRLAEMKYRLLTLPGKFETSGYVFTPYQECDEATHRILLDERNADHVRHFMVNREPISPEAHSAFVKSLRHRRDRQYYAVTDRTGNLIGSVNLDRFDTGRPEMLERGIIINAAHRSRGHARRILEELYGFLARACGTETIRTRVRKDNTASLALEKSLGATLAAEDEEYCFFTLRLK